MMVKLSKHQSDLNVLTQQGLRNLLTLLWHWWHRQCATTRWVQKEPWIYELMSVFRLLLMSSSNHCNYDSLSRLFRSDSVVFSRKTLGTVNIAITATMAILKIKAKFFILYLLVIISWLHYLEIICCFSRFHVGQGQSHFWVTLTWSITKLIQQEKKFASLTTNPWYGINPEKKLI